MQLFKSYISFCFTYIVTLSCAVYAQEEKDWFTHSIPACSNITLSPDATPSEIKCGNTALYTSELPRPLEDFQKIVRNIDAEKALNPHDQFFTGFRDFLKKKIENNLVGTRTLKNCSSPQSDLREKTFIQNGIQSSLAKKLNEGDFCDIIVGNLKNKIKENWTPMREGLQIGFSSSIELMHPSPSNHSPGFRKIRKNNVPIRQGKSRKKQLLKDHLGRGYKGKLEELTEVERSQMNQKIYEEFKSHYSQSSSYYTELEHRYPNNYEAMLDDIMKPYKGSRLTGVEQLSELDKFWNKDVGEKYRAQYFNTLAKLPILPFLKSSEPSNQEINKALSLFEKEAVELIDRLDPKANTDIKLAELANYLPALDLYLQENSSQCGYAKSWLGMNQKRKEKLEKVRLAAGLGLGAACIASLPFFYTSAPVWVCGTGTVYAGYEFNETRLKENRVSGDTKLNVFQLEGRNFTDLKAAQQEEALFGIFFAVEAIPVVGKAVKGGIKLSSAPSVKVVQQADVAVKVVSRIKSGRSGNYVRLTLSKIKPEVKYALEPGVKVLPKDGYQRAPIFSDHTRVNTSITEVAGKNKNIHGAIKNTAEEVKPLRQFRTPKFLNELPDIKKRALKKIDDPDFKRGFSKAFDDLNDPDYLISYTKQLKADTFASMLNSRDPRLIKLANEGRTDPDTMIEVLEMRGAIRGQRVAVSKEVQYSNDFATYRSSGLLYDKAFTQSVPPNPSKTHGVITHIIQQDMTYDTILKTSGKSIRELETLLGHVDKGEEIWTNMFDMASDTPTMTPEIFSSNFLRISLGLH